MQTFQPKTTDQLRAIFGLAKKEGIAFGDDDRAEYVSTVSDGRVTSTSKLSFDEANKLIVQFGGEAFPAPGHVAKRTENYRKQKANVKTLVTGRQLRMMKDLADKRNMSQIGLASLCMRIIKRSAPTTTAQCNKVIEALKSMNARDSKKLKEAA
jgi:hypothetical protein